MSKVAELRKQAGLTQRDLAIRLQVTESTIANWERGRNSLKWFKLVADLCQILKCSPADLFGLASEEPDPSTGVEDQQ